MKNLKIFTQNIEPIALNQVHELINQEAFKDCKVRIMPDVHAGSSCVIGFTANLGDKVIPNVVGVDIGCGMLTIELGKVDIDLEKLDNFIKKEIPFGFNVNEYFLYEDVSNMYINDLVCKPYLRDIPRLKKSLGSLGGGNHFIEIDKDGQDNLYLIIHSGSRNLGLQVAKYYQNLAIKTCKTASHEDKDKIIKKLKSQGNQSEIANALQELTKKYANHTKIPNDLCFLEGQNRKDYLKDMKLCQNFAWENRITMARKITDFIVKEFGLKSVRNSFQTVHNYIDEFNIVRKGAISAKLGEKVLIPINMRDGCIIAVGKGNEDWNNSAPHGAGRVMGRKQAKESLSLDEFQETMQGIYTTTANIDTLDEAPMAYKPIQEILNNIGDTVEVIKIIKPIYNFKASE